MRTLPAFILKEFRQLRRDKFMLRILLLAPVLQLIILGFSLTMETKNVKIIVCDLDNSALSRQLANSIIRNDRFNFLGYTTDYHILEESVKNWDTKIGLYIPPDFSEKINSEGTGSVLVLLDAVDGNQALTSFGYIRQIGMGGLVRFMPLHIREDYMNSGGIITAETRYWYNPELKNEAFMVPGIVVVIITIMTLLLGSMSLVKEKETGTLEQLMVTPIRKVHLILGKLIPFFIYAFIELIVCLKIAELVFGLHPAGAILNLYLALAVFLFATLGLGLLVSSMAGTQQQALFIAWFFMIFMVLLSGFFLPVENMPRWLKLVTLANPLRYMMTIMREVYIKAAPLKYLLDQLIPMAGLGAGIFIASVLRFSKKIG